MGVEHCTVGFSLELYMYDFKGTCCGVFTVKSCFEKVTKVKFLSLVMQIRISFCFVTLSVVSEILPGRLYWSDIFFPDHLVRDFKSVLSSVRHRSIIGAILSSPLCHKASMIKTKNVTRY